MNDSYNRRCQAKKPQFCPFHGPALRADAALKRGDFDSYEIAMKDAEKNKDNADAALKRGDWAAYEIAQQGGRQPSPINTKQSSPLVKPKKAKTKEITPIDKLKAEGINMRERRELLNKRIAERDAWRALRDFPVERERNS